MVFNIDIKNRVATHDQSDDQLPVCGNSGDTVVFNFDEEWSEHEKKTARFKWGGKHKDVEFTGNTCEVPPVSNTQVVLVGVYVGELPDDEDVLSSTDAVIKYKLSTRCGSTTPNPSSGKNYTNEARGYAESARADAARAEAAADKTESLEERVFGKEVEWKGTTGQVYDELDGFVMEAYIDNLEPKKYNFTRNTEDKKTYQLFDLTGMQAGEERSNGDAYDFYGQIPPNSEFLELHAEMDESGNIRVRAYLCGTDSIGDIMKDSFYCDNFYAAEYSESLQDQLTALDERVAELEKPSYNWLELDEVRTSGRYVFAVMQNGEIISGYTEQDIPELTGSNELFYLYDTGLYYEGAECYIPIYSSEKYTDEEGMYYALSEEGARYDPPDDFGIYADVSGYVVVCAKI